jgi:hypothetical protein
VAFRQLVLVREYLNTCEFARVLLNVRLNPSGSTQASAAGRTRRPRYALLSSPSSCALGFAIRFLFFMPLRAPVRCIHVSPSVDAFACRHRVIGVLGTWNRRATFALFHRRGVRLDLLLSLSERVLCHVTAPSRDKSGPAAVFLRASSFRFSCQRGPLCCPRGVGRAPGTGLLTFPVEPF